MTSFERPASDYECGKMLAASFVGSGKVTEKHRPIIAFGMIPVELVAEAEKAMPAGNFTSEMSRGFAVGILRFVGCVV